MVDLIAHEYGGFQAVEHVFNHLTEQELHALIDAIYERRNNEPAALLLRSFSSKEPRKTGKVPPQTRIDDLPPQSAPAPATFEGGKEVRYGQVTDGGLIPEGASVGGIHALLATYNLRRGLPPPKFTGRGQKNG